MPSNVSEPARSALDEAVLAALARETPDALVVSDAGGTIVFAGANVRTVLGYEPAELVGRSIEVLVPAESAPGHPALRERFLAEGRSRSMGVEQRLMARRCDDRLISVDISLTPFETAEGEVLVGAFIRDITTRERAQASLDAVLELTRAALAGESVSSLLERCALGARRLVDARDAWVVHARQVNGPEAPVSGYREALTTKQVVTTKLDDRSAVLIPLATAERDLAVLVVADQSAARIFTKTDIGLLEAYGASATVTIALAEAHLRIGELALLAEHDRIARDLHDVVIQRIFAATMRLESVLHLASDTVAERIASAVEDLDLVTREIRTTIFDLRHRGEPSVRAEVQAVVRDAGRLLGFSPGVAFDGPVDTLLDADLGAHVVAVVREALSNVMRHAHATSVDIAVRVDDAVTVTVADNGLGISSRAPIGSGLRNLRERAELLGGACLIERRETGGTIVRWSAPLSPR